MDERASGRATGIGGRPEMRASAALALAAGALMLFVGATRFLRDGSFWLDEAAIASILLSQGPMELWGPYLTGHSFPRLYLFPISLLQSAAGYSTMVVRILPFAAYVAGVVLWLRLVWLRLRSAPLMLGLLLVLALIPPTWFAYASVLKQYTLDVALALIPFLLPDAFYERRLREGRGIAALAWLTLPCLFSFTYVIPLLGRLIGWYLGGLPRGRRNLAPRAGAALAVSLVLAMALLWLIDMRHTAGFDPVFRFWAKCIPSASWARTPALLAGMVGGWYRQMPFGPHGSGLPAALVALLGLGFVTGAYAIVRRGLGPPPPTGSDEAAWGSRSLGCLVLLGGLVAASLVVRYPLCPGRLTLFALFALQIVTLEGFAFAARQLARLPRGRAAAGALIAVLVVLLAPHAWRNVRYQIVRDTPENVRPLLHHLDEEPDLPVLVAACSQRQVATLPELFEVERIEYYEERVTAGLSGWPDAEEFFVISAGSAFYCPWFQRSLETWADELVPYHNAYLHTAALYRVRMTGGRDVLGRRIRGGARARRGFAVPQPAAEAP